MDTKFDFIGMALITGLIYYVFSLSTFHIFPIFLGVLSTIIFAKYISKNDKRYQIWQAITGVILVSFFAKSTTNIALFLVGANMAGLYIYLKKEAHYLDLAVLNITVLSEITLLSGIQKFRGFNKLNVSDINMTIPLIVMITIFIYLLLGIVKTSSINVFKKIQTNAIPIVSFIFFVSFYLISFLFYKEVSAITIFVPLTLGLCAGLLDAFSKSQYNKFIQIALLVMFPYKLSGLMGIGIAILSSYMFLFIARTMLDIKQKELANTEMVYPLIFLFGASELRENAGQIMRFNLVSGIVVGWVILAILFFSILPRTLIKFEEVLTENELGDYLGITKMLLATLGLVAIIKIGQDQALGAFIIVSTIYLFVSNLVIEKKQLNNDLVLSLTGFVGSIAFFVLTKI